MRIHSFRTVLVAASLVALGAAEAEEVFSTWAEEEVSEYAELDSSWTLPEDGWADVVGEAPNASIEIDTETNDPLVYTPDAIGYQPTAARVDVRLKIVAGDQLPAITDLGECGPALTAQLIDDDSAVWYALVGGTSGKEWVQLTAGDGGPSPDVSEEGEWYDFRLELRVDENEDKQVRYSVKSGSGWIVLKGVTADYEDVEWFANPQTEGAALSKVNYAGVGAVGDFSIVNIIAETAEKSTASVTDGYDWTNATVRVDFGKSNVIPGEESALPISLELTLFDSTGVEAGTYTDSLRTDSEGNGYCEFAVGGLTPGQGYSYSVVAKLNGEEIEGFVSPSGVVPMGAAVTGWIASAATGEVGGTREPELMWNNDVATISGTSVFTLTAEKSEEATNALTRIDNTITCEDFCDAESLSEIAMDGVQGAMVAFVDADDEELTVWKGFVNGEWVDLSGATPNAGTKYVTRIEFDFATEMPHVRYSVSSGDDGFTVLTWDGDEWLPIASPKHALREVMIVGVCSFHGMEGTYFDRAVAEVNGVKYDSLIDALKAGADGTVKLLTNVTLVPGGFEGSWTINANGHDLKLYDAEEGYEVTYDAGTLEFIKTLPMLVKNVTQDLEHLTLAAAQEKANDGDELQLLGELGQEDTLVLTKSLVFDLNGCSLTSAVENTKMLLVTNNAALLVGGTGAMLGSIEVTSGSEFGLDNDFAPTSAVKVAFSGAWEHGVALVSGVDAAITNLFELDTSAIVTDEKPAWGVVEYDADQAAFLWVEIPPSVEVKLSFTDGFDYTNAILNVEVSNVKGDIATLTVGLYEDGELVSTQNIPCTEAGDYQVDLVGLDPSKAYECRVFANGGDSGTVKAAGATVGVLYSGCGGDVWFLAEPENEIGGEWEADPTTENGMYVLEGDDYVFTPTEASPSNAFVMTEWAVTFTEGADADTDEVDGHAAFSLFADGNGGYVWKGLAAGGWEVLANDAVPAQPGTYQVRVEIDYSLEMPCVRYSIVRDGQLYSLADTEGNIWFETADATDRQLKSVIVSGQGKLAYVSGTYYEDAVAEVGEEKFASIAAALAVVKDNDKVAKILTNLTWEPGDGDSGTYHINKNGFEFLILGPLADSATWEDETTLVVGSAYVVTDDDEDVKAKIPVDWVKEMTGVDPAKDKDAADAAMVSKGENGFKRWESYVLGLDPQDPQSKPVLKNQQTVANDTLKIFVDNVHIRSEAGVKVTYVVQTADKSDFKDATDKVSADGTFEIDLPASGSATRYIALKVVFANIEE